MHAYSELIIDSAALLKNLHTFGAIPIMPMIKGEGYGLGMVELARFLEPHHFPFFGVSHPSEGILLREGGIETPILVDSFIPEQAPLLIDYQLTPVVDTLEKVDAVAHAVQTPFPVHLKINLGMNRFGVNPKELPLLEKKIRSSPSLYLDGFMGHLSGPESPAFDDVTREQLAIFERALSQLISPPRWIHVASSGAYRRFACGRSNLIRIGMGLLQPNPVLTLRSRILALRSVDPGESIGYRSLPISKPIRLAILGIGYHDGWHPSYGKQGGFVIIDGQPAPILGEICMDFMFVDVSNISSVAVGDWAELFGHHLPLEKLARTIETNPRVIISSLSPRIKRTWKHESLCTTHSTNQKTQTVR